MLALLTLAVLGLAPDRAARVTTYAFASDARAVLELLDEDGGRAVLRFTDPQGTPGKSVFLAGLAGAELTADRSRLVVRTRGGLGAWTGAGDATRISGPCDFYAGSADGTVFAVVRGGVLAVIDCGRVVTERTTGPAAVAGLALAGDGSRVAWAAGGAVTVTRIGAREPDRVATLPAGTSLDRLVFDLPDRLTVHWYERRWPFPRGRLVFDFSDTAVRVRTVRSSEPGVPTGGAEPGPAHRATAAADSAPGWPLAPTDSVHPLGNNWGEFQGYGGAPYFHPGIDVMSDSAHRPVYAVADGVVRAWLTIAADYHWRIATGDLGAGDSSDGWLYAHLDPGWYHPPVGDTVRVGDIIGFLVPWPVTGFTHCHFARIRDAGPVWSANWRFLENPLRLIEPATDTCLPAFEDARLGQRFAFFANGTNQPLDPDRLSGDVDVVVRAVDRFGPALAETLWERLVPYEIWYAVHGPDSLARTRSLVFGGRLDYTSNVDVPYRVAPPCSSAGDYERRDYCFTVTNTDGDTLIEAEDAGCALATGVFYDGAYQIVVGLRDAAGNETVDSMPVRFVNGNIPGGLAEAGTPVRPPVSSMIGPRFELVLPAGGLVIYNAAGQRVFCCRTGPGRLRWDGRDQSGHRLAPGIYFAVPGAARPVIRLTVVR